MITVFEHETLRVGERGFTAKHHAVLARWQVAQSVPYFSLRPDAVVWSHYVGSMRIGALTVEVLPKIGRGYPAAAWRAVLRTMLDDAHHVSAPSGLGRSATPGEWLPDTFLASYANALDHLARRGWQANYRPSDEHLPTLRGALRTTAQLRQNALRPTRFAVRCTRQDTFSALHGLLQQALTCGRRLATSPALAVRLAQTSRLVPQGPPVADPLGWLDRLTYDPQTLPYRPALQLARLLLMAAVPVGPVGLPVVAWLFDVRRLFEQYVYRQLADNCPAGGQLRWQRSHPFWGAHPLRPDLVLRRGAHTCVVDVKWQQPIPTAADLRQVYVYSRYAGARHAVLLFPAADTAHAVTRDFHPAVGETTAQCTCSIQQWPLLCDGKPTGPQGANLWECLLPLGLAKHNES